ncbi:unnamed protein product [Arctia plantaginis]|uniref:CCHC-type domain-containing protein n=1 Tax=Arctia plantaginis TaxID=874455 RepID=A0A8S1AFU8_ARCPL|nr:unnamed protein product [Arctia plantaginis]
MLTGEPQEGEFLAAYASRLFTLLMSRWSNSGKEEMVVSLMLAHMGQIESRLQRNIFSEEGTVYRMTSSKQLRSLSAPTRPLLLVAVLTCYKCGVEGHVASWGSKIWPVASSSTQPTAVPSVVKRVDICCMTPVTGIITQFGEQFPFCFDSVSRKLVGIL